MFTAGALLSWNEKDEKEVNSFNGSEFILN